MTTVIESKTLGEIIYKETLDNGLDVFIMPKKGYAKQYVLYATSYGSIDSSFIVGNEENITEVPDGIAHFLEHKMFEEETGNIFDKYAELGISANAFTSFTTTAYLFSSTDNFYEGLDTLLHSVGSPYFTDENVEKEKGIIGQEIRMYEDNPHWRVFFNMLDGLFVNHPVKKDIAGTIDSIDKITKDILLNCYNTFYNPGNMVLFICGDLEHAEVMAAIKKNFGKADNRQAEIVRIFPKEPEEINKRKIQQELAVSMPLFAIGFKDTDVGYGGRQLLEKEMMTHMILELMLGRSSELYNSLYEEGLINNTFEKDYTGEKNYGFSMVAGESENPELVEERILNEIERIRNQGLNEEQFERIRKKMIGDFLRNFNSLEFISSQFISYYFKKINIFDIIDILEKVSFEQITDRFNSHFNGEKHCISIILPKSE